VVCAERKTGRKRARREDISAAEPPQCYEMKPVAKEIFDPAKAKEPRDPKPSIKMDDPAVLREQHKR